MSVGVSIFEPATTDEVLWLDSTVRTDKEFWDKHLRREYYELENSTMLQESPAEIEQEIEALFIRAKEEIFEDGMESEFSKGLVSMIRRYCDDAIEVIAKLILYEKVNQEVSSEALRWLGYIDHAPTYNERLWLLERSLGCSSAWVRDGASLGLAFLDDPHAIPYLRQAIQREKYKELREDMEQVLEQLLETAFSVSHPEKNTEV